MNIGGEGAALASMQPMKLGLAARLLLLPVAVLLPPLAVLLCCRAGPAFWLNLLLASLGALVFVFLFAGPGLAIASAASLHAVVRLFR